MRAAQQELRRYQNRPKAAPSVIDLNTDSQSIVVNAPVSEVYHRCLRFEEFPAFISSIKKIERVGDTRFSCTSIINGEEVKSDVLIMMRVPDRRIAWQAVSDHFRVGVVSLDPRPHNTTRVSVKVRSIIEPMILTEALRHYLRKFKVYIENETEQK